MKILTRRSFTLLAVLFSATCLVEAGQQTTSTAQQTALSAPIPVDGQITVGQLPNGIRYYVRANTRPERRAELRLVVRDTANFQLTPNCVELFLRFASFCN